MVDINPHKQGTYNAGTAQKIIASEDLVALEPALVIVMNPVYEREIGANLAALGIRTRVEVL